MGRALYIRCALSIEKYGIYFRSADKSLARPVRKQANVPVRMAWISFSASPCRGGNQQQQQQQQQLDDRSLLDVVEIARIPDMFPSLFPSWSG